MPIQRYGLVKAIAKKGELYVPQDGIHQPHYHILLDASGRPEDVAVNVESGDKGGLSAVLYLVHDNLTLPNIDKLRALPLGAKPLQGQHNDLALDFELMGLVKPSEMSLLPTDGNRPSILHNAIDDTIQKAIQSGATIIAWGQLFRNGGKSNPQFGFSPDQGIHDIHRNNGNKGHWAQDNGTYQDGAIAVLWDDGRVSMIFIAFQSQTSNGEWDS